MTAVDRIFLTITGLLAAHQIAIGMEGLHITALISYTVAFGTLLLAGLLLIILGFETLESPAVVLASSFIPLGLSSGLISEHLDRMTTAYLVFAAAGLVMIAITRLAGQNPWSVPVLGIVHGAAGLVITVLPIMLALRGTEPAGFSLIGVGGALFGTAGLLLSLHKSGHPLVSQRAVLSLLPIVMMITTAAFVLGFSTR